MEFRDLKKQYEILKSDIDAAMQRVASESHYIMGPEVKQLEALLAEYVGVKHCITCANGTDALTIALKIWGIGKGDAVFVPDFTFFSSAEVIAGEGAEPVFVDVSKKSFNICPGDLEAAIEETLKEGRIKPKAIIAVDLFGQSADYDKIKTLAEKYKLLILEDGAQGFGGEIRGKKACSFGDIATTSFFPAKPLGCYGDGGAIFTDRDDWAALAESIRVHGKGSQKYDNVRLGLNSRLDTLQAAILQIKLKAFKESELAAVNQAAQWYNEALSSIVAIPEIKDGYLSSWAQYTIRLKNQQQRDTLQARLKEKGIPTMVYYPIPMSAQTAFSKIHRRSCPNALELSQTVLSLPMHPYLTKADIEHIASELKAAL